MNIQIVIIGKRYNDLKPEEQEVVKDKVPIIISLAEPEAVKK